MPISTIVKTKRDGTLTFADSGGANSLTVAFEAGDFTVDIPQESVDHYLDRGVIGATPSLRNADDNPMTGSFTAYLRDLSDAAYATLEEILLQSGFVGSTWVSTMGANGEVFTLTMTWTIEGTDHGDASDHVLSLPFCVVRGSLSEGQPNMINLTFTSYAVRPTPT